MIIFGFRSFVKNLAMLTLVCRSCGNPAAHRLVQRSRWFTLFFVPLIPVSFTRYTVCAFCGTTTKISKQDADHLVLSAHNTPAAPQVGTGAPQALDPERPTPGAGPA